MSTPHPDLHLMTDAEWRTFRAGIFARDEYDDGPIERRLIDGLLIARRTGTEYTGERRNEDGVLIKDTTGEAAGCGSGPGLDAVLQEVTQWQRETFPNQPLSGSAAHLKKEVLELVAHPDDPGELADCAMLVARCADLAGVDLAAAVRDKLAICRTREWGEPDADGSVQHLEEDPQATAASSAVHARTRIVTTHSGSRAMGFSTMLGGFRVSLSDGGEIELDYHDAMLMADWMTEKRAAIHPPVPAQPVPCQKCDDYHDTIRQLMSRLGYDPDKLRQEHFANPTANEGRKMSEVLLELARKSPVLAAPQLAVEDLPPAPRDTLIRRVGDMHPADHLALTVQQSGDVIVMLFTNGIDHVDVEFCCGGGGGGRSKHTLRALHRLAAAMAKDEAENPIVFEYPKILFEYPNEERNTDGPDR